MTTFTELFREAKEGKKLVARPINQDLQKHIDSLNKMFSENWSPLFDKDKNYELWSDYSNHVYFGNNYQHILVVNKSTIDTIELAPVNWSLIKRFPYPLKTMYVMILKHLVMRKIIGEFKRAVIDSGLSVIFDEVQDLDYLIRDMNNVLGENTFVFNDNTIKFKDEIIKVDNLNFMRNCYNTLNEDLLYTDTPKDYKEVNLDLFNLLKTDRELRGNLIKLLITLKNLYLNEVNTFYPKEWIEDTKNKFESLCHKYTISPNDYFLYPTIRNNSISWIVAPKRTELDFDSYFSLNTWYTHRDMKNISKEVFYNSFEELEDKVLNVAIKEVNNTVAEKIVNESLKPIKKLNLSMRDLDNEIDFNGCKISVKTKDGKLTLKYKDYTFHVPYYSPNSVHTYFEKENGVEDNKTWVKTKEDIQTVADLFIEFLNS